MQQVESERNNFYYYYYYHTNYNHYHYYYYYYRHYYSWVHYGGWVWERYQYIAGVRLWLKLKLLPTGMGPFYENISVYKIVTLFSSIFLVKFIKLITNATENFKSLLTKSNKLLESAPRLNSLHYGGNRDLAKMKWVNLSIRRMWMDLYCCALNHSSLQLTVFFVSRDSVFFCYWFFL